MKIYTLIQDFNYEGYSCPHAAWDHYPSKQEIFDFLAPNYHSSFLAYGFKTIEETRAHETKQLWKSINNGEWIIEECELISHILQC